MEVISTADALNRVDTYNAELGNKTERVETSEPPEAEEYVTDDKEFLTGEEIKESQAEEFSTDEEAGGMKRESLSLGRPGSWKKRWMV